MELLDHLATYVTGTLEVHGGQDNYASVKAGIDVKGGLKLEIDILSQEIHLISDLMISNLPERDLSA